MIVYIVGYGKIGQIKAGTWKSLGYSVIVFDLSPSKLTLAIKDGYQIFSRDLNTESIVDISTPAGMHANGLRWVLENIKRPTLIIMEKPLVSSPHELADLQALIKSSNNSGLAERIFLNESYLSSKVINRVLKDITKNGEKLTDIKIELSKNRLADADSGRFFDHALGALGIELPHMIALLQLFNINVLKLSKLHSTLLKGSGRTDNQGFTLQGKVSGVTINLATYLGDFRYLDNQLNENIKVTREMSVSTTKRRYEITFDPAPGVPRYHVRLRTYISNVLNNEQIIPDDHLRNHLSHLASGTLNDKALSMCSLQNAVSLTSLLFELAKTCQIKGVLKTPLATIELTHKQDAGVLSLNK